MLGLLFDLHENCEYVVISVKLASRHGVRYVVTKLLTL